MSKCIATIEDFRDDVDSNVWYIIALKEKLTDYWNFNSFLYPDLRPAIVTRDETNTICNSMHWEKAETYKGFVFWIPIN